MQAVVHHKEKNILVYRRYNDAKPSIQLVTAGLGGCRRGTPHTGHKTAVNTTQCGLQQFQNTTKAHKLYFVQLYILMGQPIVDPSQPDPRSNLSEKKTAFMRTLFHPQWTRNFLNPSRTAIFSINQL